MLNSKITFVVISSIARNLLDSSTYAIMFYLLIVVDIFCCYLRIQEISRFTQNDKLRAVFSNLTLSS